jgi:hypothetical protein
MNVVVKIKTVADGMIINTILKMSHYHELTDHLKPIDHHLDKDFLVILSI